jgi:hypothetical protein
LQEEFEQLLLLHGPSMEIKAMPLFTFNLDTFQITQTRSAHKDTDYVIFTMKLSSEGRAESFPVTQLGNLNNGTYKIGFDSTNNTVLPDSPVVLNYLIVNSSLDISTVTTQMSNISEYLADGPLPGLPPFTSAMSYVNREYASEISKLTKPGSCDGLVAAEQNNFTYEELVNYNSRSPYFTQVTEHVGAQAPGGCNSKPSAYQVRWSMMHMLAVPNVVGLPVGTAKLVGTAGYELAQASLQWEAEPPLGPTAYVARQNPTGFCPINLPVILTTQNSSRIKPRTLNP